MAANAGEDRSRVVFENDSVRVIVELKDHGPTPDPDHPVLPALGPSDDPNATGSRPPAEDLGRPAPGD